MGLDWELLGTAKRGDVGRVRELLWRGANVNAKDCVFGYTPLHAAARYGHADVVRLLLEHGADVNTRDNVIGYTPLHHAAINGNLDVVAAPRAWRRCERQS